MLKMYLGVGKIGGVSSSPSADSILVAPFVPADFVVVDGFCTSPSSNVERSICGNASYMTIDGSLGLYYCCWCHQKHPSGTRNSQRIGVFSS